METYLGLLRDVLENGESRSDRTGTGTLSVFGRQVRYDLRAGFPCLTTKKLHLRSIIHELLWFLRGETNTRYLRENGVTIWDEWADAEGELGSIDQIHLLIDGLLGNPHSRRHIVSAWNVGQLHQMALPPCHLLFQFYVHEAPEGGRPGLSCQLYQRSADLFLGVPFNIASYALLTEMVAHVCSTPTTSTRRASSSPASRGRCRNSGSIPRCAASTPSPSMTSGWKTTTPTRTSRLPSRSDPKPFHRYHV